MLNNNFEEIISACIYSGIAVMGGIVSYLSTTTNFLWRDLFVKGLSSGFTGTLIGLLCIYWQLPEALTYFLCGTFGYIGSEATITLIKKYLIKRINKLE